MLEDVGPLVTPGTIGFLYEFKRKWTHHVGLSVQLGFPLLTKLDLFGLVVI